LRRSATSPDGPNAPAPAFAGTHLVYVVLPFEGEPNSLLRHGPRVKNGFGAAAEVGLFSGLLNNGMKGL